MPRQLLVAEEMDSFFPFDPLKLPLSSLYIDSIYSHWIADDEDTSESSSTSTFSSDDEEEEESSSEVDTETESDFAGRVGLAVPGSNRNRGGKMEDDLDAEVARSFEAMSLSLSPNRQTFGGRTAGGRMSGIVI
jgi:RNA polymerase I-specific transcription initiation factor RRN3